MMEQNPRRCTNVFAMNVIVKFIFLHYTLRLHSFPFLFILFSSIAFSLNLKKDVPSYRSCFASTLHLITLFFYLQLLFSFVLPPQLIPFPLFFLWSFPLSSQHPQLPFPLSLPSDGHSAARGDTEAPSPEAPSFRCGRQRGTERGKGGEENKEEKGEEEIKESRRKGVRKRWEKEGRRGRGQKEGNKEEKWEGERKKLDEIRVERLREGKERARHWM